MIGSPRATTIGSSAPARGPAPSGSRRRLVVAAAIVAALLLVWLLFFSSLLGARTVTVTGTKLLTAQQVRAAADIAHGSPLIRLDTSAIAQRIEKLPEVASAEVSRSYPATVRIKVIERVPVGYHQDGSVITLVDATDVDIRTVAKIPSGTPRLERSNDQAVTDAIANVAGALPHAVAAKTGSISAQTAESITLHLTDGRSVMWGGTDNAADKAALLPALLSQPGQYFDISDPSAVIARQSN